MELIDKSALVVEIEKLISNAQVKLQESQENNDQVSYIAWTEHIATCIKILSLLDTLEVKEVDLEKEYEEFIDCDNGRSMFETAKYFFELGIKAKKGE